ncbi:unnamed protein product (macronuclear) [Paramecium tetraurelia]|uniref:Alpha-type protein kinase domain-containing protein n=1 Tax=Paramecium tetraurelia TaxID=5888 RepID=A0CHT8_PARTE|nr:uncharacterized protein GSPATT00038457001 [Paramecium tetraurelia]CAK70355.1 unnamed protein product [Paramecium tetraurelia]|eukprot:XP_001437752.1 hypothetical protein (macronuclear) [Paramecium tetraurelia strain d4-2]
MKRPIQILPINIPGRDAPIVLEIGETDLFHFQAKKIVAGQLKNYSQDEFVFYSRSKNLVVHEDDRVSKLFLSKEQNEIELYLTSNLIKKAVLGEQGNQQIGGQFQNNYESEIQELKKEIKNLQAKLQEYKSANKMSIYNNEEKELRDQLGQMKKEFDDRLKVEEEYRANIIKKYNESQNAQTEQKKELLQKEKHIEELKYQQRLMEAEKKFLEEQNKKEILLSIQSQGGNNLNNQLAEIRFEFEKVKALYQEEQFERTKDKEIISQQQKKLQKLETKLQKEIEELQQGRFLSQSEISKLKQELTSVNEKCYNYKCEIQKQKVEIDRFVQTLELGKQKIGQLEKELNISNAEINNLKRSEEEKINEIRRKEVLVNEIKNSKDVQQTIRVNLEQEKSDLQKQLQTKTDRCRQLEQENALKSADIKHLESRLQEEINAKNDNIQKAKIQKEDLVNRLQKEQDNLKAEKEAKNKLVERIKENALLKAKDEKIISPTEALLRNIPNPLQFLKIENIMTKDLVAVVEIIKVDKKKAIESLTKQNPKISQFITRERVGNWEFKQSIAINGDGTKRKGFLMQITGSEENRYNDKVFLIKELIGFEKIVSSDKALYVAQNTLIAKVLAEHFQDRIHGVSKIFPQRFSYNELFLLNIEDKYYIAEQVQEGRFIKFNGKGESHLSDKEQYLKSYFYAFSIFTYFVTQKMLMVTNIQGFQIGSEYILCDPIVSSPEGLMGDEDLAEQHILEFEQNYQSNPKKYGKEFLQILGY